MKPRVHDPRRLDVAALAAEGGLLRGRWPAEELGRLNELQTLPADAPAGEFEWSATGSLVPVRGGEPETWLHLRALGSVWMACQRCLQPLSLPLVVDRRIRFVRDESQAEALDAELEDDVLALTRSLNLQDLVEDEFLLALPLVPRHEHCPQPLPINTDEGLPDDVPEEAPPHPFAALQGLKRRTPS
jgi:uncharacterized protein